MIGRHSFNIGGGFMKKSLWSLTLLLALLSYLPAFAAPAPAKKEAMLQLMFVQSAKGVAFDENKMTLKGISPSTIFFADRPERITGHLTVPAFLKEWDEGKDSFKADPPNATLSIFSETKVDYVVVELMNPRLEGEDLSYDVRVLQGTPPAKGGISSLFIDWYSYPYGPYGYGPYYHRNWYTGPAYYHRPGWYAYPGYRYNW
jgi:hypothetical protein